MTLASLTALDWVLVALLVYSTVRAFLRGFLREVFALIGLVAGILLASWNYIDLARSLHRWITTETTAQIVAFILIVVGVMIACALAGKLLRTSADAIGLGFVDRLLGAAFGFARGCLLGVACMMILAAFGPRLSWTENSQLTPYFLAGAHGVSFVVPHNLEQQIANGAAQLKHSAPDWIKQPK
jgi:membrane protein required for colicin V production